MLIEDDVGDQVREACFEVVRDCELGNDYDGSDVDGALGADADGLIASCSSLVYSRLVSLGFLFEAMLAQMNEYQVCEVLDGRECPVCEHMDGLRFEVAIQYDQIEQALSQMDPAALKAASPWPKQTPEAVEEIAAMTAAELQARGWGAPPYHPCCRGYLILPDDPSGPAG